MTITCGLYTGNVFIATEVLVLHNTCNMCIHDLPDMYALIPWACGPWASGIHIRLIPHVHVTTITYITGNYKSARKLDFDQCSHDYYHLLFSFIHLDWLKMIVLCHTICIWVKEVHHLFIYQKASCFMMKILQLYM